MRGSEVNKQKYRRKNVKMNKISLLRKNENKEKLIDHFSVKKQQIENSNQGRLS